MKGCIGHFINWQPQIYSFNSKGLISIAGGTPPLQMSHYRLHPQHNSMYDPNKHGDVYAKMKMKWNESGFRPPLCTYAKMQRCWCCTVQLTLKCCPVEITWCNLLHQVMSGSTGTGNNNDIILVFPSLLFSSSRPTYTVADYLHIIVVLCTLCHCIVTMVTQ